MTGPELVTTWTGYDRSSVVQEIPTKRMNHELDYFEHEENWNCSPVCYQFFAVKIQSSSS